MSSSLPLIHASSDNFDTQSSTSSIWIDDCVPTDEELNLVWRGPFLPPTVVLSKPTRRCSIRVVIAFIVLSFGAGAYAALKYHVRGGMIMMQGVSPKDAFEKDTLPTNTNDQLRVSKLLAQQLEVQEENIRLKQQMKQMIDTNVQQQRSENVELGHSDAFYFDIDRHRDLATFYRMLAFDKYGAGPIRIIFSVQFGHDKVQTFTVEVGSFNAVPIAAFVFLEQVDHQVWDHSLASSANPEMVPVIKAVDHLHDMQLMGLHKLPLQDYLAVDFMDNESYALGYRYGTVASFFSIQRGGVGFAKVISGIETVERMVTADGLTEIVKARYEIASQPAIHDSI
jgi:hypothetical protein